MKLDQQGLLRLSARKFRRTERKASLGPIGKDMDIMDTFIGAIIKTMGCCQSDRKVEEEEDSPTKIQHDPRERKETQEKPSVHTHHHHTSTPKKALELPDSPKQPAIKMLQMPITNYYEILSSYEEHDTCAIFFAKYRTGQSCMLTQAKKSIQGDLKGFRTALIAEAQLVRSLDHPNIIQIYELLEDADSFYVAFESAIGGRLLDYCLASHRMSEGTAAKVIRQLLSAIHYCHQRNIVHRNLSLESIFLKSKPGNREAHIKLADFARACPFSSSQPLREVVGPLHYVAPEVLQGHYNEKCDIWSCGVILYILLSGILPFDGLTNLETLQCIKCTECELTSDYWSDVGSEAKDLVKRMLDKDYTRRPSAEQCLKHSWLRKPRGTIVPNSKGDNPVSASLYNLTKFQSGALLKQAVMRFIANRVIPDTEKVTCEESFKALDSDKDGKISRRDLLKGLAQIMERYQAIETAERVMKSVDLDNNGFIDYSEFLLASVNPDCLLSTENLSLAFKSMDLDGNGTISIHDLNEMLHFGKQSKAARSFKEILREVNLQSSGEIEFDQFVDLMRKTSESEAHSRL